MTTNTWRSNLRPASWRGVSFEVNADDSEFGRNAVVHEFVQRDKPYVEDLGRKTRRFKLDAWICAGVQNNFNPWPQRDALIAAVEEGGIGTLVHPFFGSLRGHVLNISVKQSSSERGGFIAMALDFVEAGELEFRTDEVEDTQAMVDEVADQALDDVAQEFAANFSVQDVPSFVLADAVDMVGQYLGIFESVVRPLSLEAQVAQRSLQAVSIYSRPVDLAAQVVALMSDCTRPALFENFSRPQPPAIDTVGRRRQSSNQAAFTHLVRVASLVRSAQLSADLAATSTRYAATSTVLRSTPQLITRADMQARRQAITESFGIELMALSELSMYPTTQQALVDLRTAAVQHLTVEGEHLARTFTTTCCDGTGWNAFMPTLVLAYRHYGLLTDDVINERNEIPNPLFIEPRAAVELLCEVDP